MPRMQIYLPADLYEVVKERHLPASELLQKAVRNEVLRRELEAASRRYTAELAVEVGQPSPRQRARAAGVARRIAGRLQRKAGQSFSDVIKQELGRRKRASDLLVGLDSLAVSGRTLAGIESQVKARRQNRARAARI